MSTLTIGKLARSADVGGDTVRFYVVEIEQRLVDFGRMRDTLRGLVDKCHGEGSLEGCPIIETVLGSNAAAPIKVRDRRTS